MPIVYASTAAMAAADTSSAAFTDFSFAETTDEQRLWVLSKASAATVGSNVIAANPAGRWLAAQSFYTMPWAGTLYVSSGGSDATAKRNVASLPYATVQAALNAASSGDTILVGPGTFTGAITWPNVDNLKLRGMGAEVTRITSTANDGIPTIKFPNTLTSTVLSATIQDLEIEKTDTTSTTNACLFVDITGTGGILSSNTGLTLRNVKATRNAPAGAGAGFYDSFSFSQVNNINMFACAGSARFFNCGTAYVLGCKFSGQGDVFGGLITNWSNPSGTVVTAGQGLQRYIGCVMTGSAANSVNGLQIGGAPRVEFMDAIVTDGIGNNGSLTRYSAALVPVVRFRGQVDGNISITYSGATNAGTFDFDQLIHTSGTNTWSSSSVRQSVLMRNASLTTITPQSRIDLNIRKSVYTSFTGTIGANGATVDRDVEGTTLTMAGGTANFTGIFPWPTGATVRLSATMTTAAAPNAARATITAAIVGPQAATGTVAVVCGAGTDTVDVEVTRTG